MISKIYSNLDSKKGVRVGVLLFYEIVVIFLAEMLALLTRFEFSYKNIDVQYVEGAYRYTVVNIILTVIIFAIAKLYSSLWRYASVQELFNVIVACFLSACVQSMGMHMMEISMPRSY